MKSSVHPSLGLASVLVLAGCASQAFEGAEAERLKQSLTGGMLDPHPNAAGQAQTATPTGSIDEGTEFFQNLRLFNRNCGSCHTADAGWSVTPVSLRARFDATQGTDPVFRTFDTANYPNAPVDTLEDRKASYGRFLRKGVVRVQLPATAPFRQFRLTTVTPPAGEPANAGYPAGTISFFRRPLPTSNLRFASTVNWDGRSAPGAAPNAPAPIPVPTGLLNQSNGATLNHAWLPNPASAFVPITTEQRTAIVTQELALHLAQTIHLEAGELSAGGATAGAEALLSEPGGAAGGNVFTLFDAWTNDSNPVRRSIADGQRIFNTKQFAGTRTCAGCHNSKNVGTSVDAVFFDVGVSNPTRAGDVTNWQADVPLFTFERTTIVDGVTVGTGELIQTTDPGRALFSGAWGDMNRFKVPVLRGLAARAPYFHDGSARDIKQVVNHYTEHFAIVWEKDEKSNLVRFLEAL
jgi:cytochrome c peroxidase